MADHSGTKNTFNTAIGRSSNDAKGDLKDFEFAVFKWDKNGKKTQLQTRRAGYPPAPQRSPGFPAPVALPGAGAIWAR